MKDMKISKEGKRGCLLDYQSNAMVALEESDSSDDINFSFVFQAWVSHFNQTWTDHHLLPLLHQNKVHHQDPFQQFQIVC